MNLNLERRRSMTSLSCHLRKSRGAPKLRFECFCLTACLAVCNDKSCCWVILQILDLVVAEKSQMYIDQPRCGRTGPAGRNCRCTAIASMPDKDLPALTPEHHVAFWQPSEQLHWLKVCDCTFDHHCKARRHRRQSAEAAGKNIGCQIVSCS